MTSALRSGFTLLELVLSVGLLSLLMVGVLQMFDTTLELWDRTETRRDLVEIGSSVVERMADDLAGLHPGERGDLVFEWVAADGDGDGIANSKWPRLRLVRTASAAERQRLSPSDTSTGSRVDGRVEVCWLVRPDGNLPATDPRRPLGVLWRGERAVGDEATISFFDPGFFDSAGQPVGGLEPVTGGVLWFQLLFASHTTLLHDGWKTGGRLQHATTSWDAWTKKRPDLDQHAWNERAAGMLDARDVPVLPRRVRIELEFERPRDVKRRAHLTEAIDGDAGTLRVSDPTKLPRDGAFLLLDEEWVEVIRADGRLVSVRRGMRGTTRTPHEARTLLHFGASLVREVPVVLHREDWGL